MRLAPVTNIERMYALDEAWNARDWDTFDAYHDQRFCAAFHDNKVKHPYDILFGDGELPDKQGDEQTPDTEESK